jgi:hypothetical protein
MRRAFFEEYKIHCFNFILLLFESVVRILTTIQVQQGNFEDEGSTTKVNEQYYSNNYRRFLEHRNKKLEQFNVNTIGWSHVQRIIEVLEMSIRDLIYKIVPAQLVIRELKTSTGKVLTKESVYHLEEKKQYVTVGKKTKVEYVFELDVKD